MVLTSAQSQNMEKAESSSAEKQEDQDTTDKLVKLLNLFKFTIIVMFLAGLHEVQKSNCSHPGHTRSRSRSTLLKFSRSLYLDN